jgi:hypothetical protein
MRREEYRADYCNDNKRSQPATVTCLKAVLVAIAECEGTLQRSVTLCAVVWSKSFLAHWFSLSRVDSLSLRIAIAALDLQAAT